MKNKQKGFINIAIIAITAVSVVAFGLYTGYKTNEAVKKAQLGATILQTETTNTIGTFRTNVNTSLTNINNALSNTTSGDPGHYHTLSNDASATGTLPIRKGGTATTTFNNGLVMASGTNAFSSLQINGNGSIPIASGTAWVANTLTAGSNITINNSAGGISISGVADPTSVVQIASVKLTEASSTFYIDNLPHRDFYWVKAHIAGVSVAGGLWLRFNNSNAPIYHWRSILDDGTRGDNNNATEVTFGQGSFSNPTFLDLQISNATSTIKTFTTDVIRNITGTAAPDMFNAYGAWNNTTTTINRIDIIPTGGGNFSSSSYIRVYAAPN